MRMEDETVWLTQAQMAELFQTTPQNITIHIRSIYKEHELEKLSTCKDYLQVRHRLQFPILQHRRSRCQSTIIRNNDRKQQPRLFKVLGSAEDGVYSSVYTHPVGVEHKVVLADVGPLPARVAAVVVGTAAVDALYLPCGLLSRNIEP